MTHFLLRRLAGFIATLWVASVLVFAALELLPGSAAQVRLGETASPEAVAALEAQLGLGRPAPQRYAEWITGLARGHTALSSAYDTPTADLIAERLQVSLPLAVLAMALTTAMALALGLYAAAHHRRLGDVGVMAASQVGMAVPSFWFAILLILLFSVQLEWFDAGGFAGWTDADSGVLTAASLWDGLRALVLPALALAVVQAAILARVTRSAVLEVLREDFVRTARAKGVGRRAVLWRHVLRNAMIPVLTVMGLQFANLVAGTVVIEKVFVLPGVGLLVFQAIANRDLVVVRDVVMLLAASVVVINAVVDLLYAVLDPRLRTVGGS